MVDAIESRLQENQWLGGQQPSKEDADEFAGLSGSVPNVDTHPNTYSWYALVGKFTVAVRGTWAAGSAAPAGVSIQTFLVEINEVVVSNYLFFWYYRQRKLAKEARRRSLRLLLSPLLLRKSSMIFSMPIPRLMPLLPRPLRPRPLLVRPRRRRLPPSPSLSSSGKLSLGVRKPTCRSSLTRSSPSRWTA